MADGPAYLSIVAVVVNLATTLLLLAVAGLLAFAPRPDRSRWLLALALAVVGARLVGSGWILLDTGQGMNPFFFYNRYFDLFTLGALVLFLASHPSPVRWRSWHGAAAAAGVALFAVGMLAWLFQRSWLWPEWPARLAGATLLHWLVFGPGGQIVLLALAASAVVRARDLPDAERAGTWTVAALLLTNPLSFLGSVGVDLLAEAAGIPTALPSLLPLWTRVPGDCCDLVLGLIVAQLVATAAFVAWGLRQGRRAGALVLAIAALYQMLVVAGATPLYLAQSLLALGVLHVLGRGGLGPFEAPPRAWLGFALAAFVAGFFYVIGAGVSLAGEPLAFPLLVLLGLMVGAAAAHLVLPPGMGWSMAAGPLDERRVATYRAALQAELDHGLEGPALAAKLRPLRAELGLSDREHAVLEHALAQRSPRNSALEPGRLFLGRYRVEGLLGRGSAGEVHLARDERLGRQVAIKRLAGDQRRDALALERFQREMRLASALHHPHIVAVHDVETVGDEAYVVMEYVPGGTLEQRLARGPLPEAEALAIATDVLAALAALHARGIVHRDVKPSNILLSAGRAKLSDFSVARETISGETVGLARPAPGAVGTLEYMAPEQARGLPASPASDLYGLGATLYAAIAGGPPIAVQGLGDFEARLAVMEAPPRLPLEAASARVNRALARALAKDPARRFPDAGAMAAALDGLTRGGTPGGSGRRRGRPPA